jgi:hypothetical protein
MAVSGTGLSGSATFTADQAGASSFTVTSNAASANGASTIVARDASGNFTANTGTFTTVSGAGGSITAINASNISTGTLANARTTATNVNGASTIVARDASGNFSAGTITANLTGTASNATAVTGSTSNGFGTRTVSTGDPTGGSDGDIWYKYA